MKCCTTVQTISMRMTIQIYHFILISWLYPTSSDSRFSDFTLKSTTLQPTWWLHFPIVNFPFISSNIPESQAYGVYISQLIRYSRACTQMQWFSGQSSAHRSHKNYSNKATLLLCWSHRYNNSTVVITIWLTVKKYPYLKWQ
jgi:hypothetical protein